MAGCGPHPRRAIESAPAAKTLYRAQLKMPTRCVSEVVNRRCKMSWMKIAGLGVVLAIGAAIAQQFAAPARAAAPIVRASYVGLGAAVNESTAVVWLLGSDGGVKVCTHSATGPSTDAPVCSAAATP
jgi:hypothetical protein